MYFIQFTTLRAVEYVNPIDFDKRIRKWLLLREGENTYLLEQLVRIVEEFGRTRLQPTARMFTVEDEGAGQGGGQGGGGGGGVVAAGVLLAASPGQGGCFCMSWATEEIAEALIAYMLKAGCRLSSVYAPGHISSRFAERWAQQTGQSVDYGRSERVYQVSRVTHVPPASGRLALATAADQAFLIPWIRGFIDEASKETDNSPRDTMLARLIERCQLYLWHNPAPVAMAVWVRTESQNSINFVYVPPIHRGQGHAKAVTAALAMHILASGHRSCFILTDTHDELTNHLYRSIGGYPVTDLLRCTLGDLPPAAAPRAIRGATGLNIVNAPRF
jgi:predicted GNAT family acetyltransferase